MSPSTSSFVPYQIDYSVHNTAKTLGFSKKKVVFKFGFANESSIRQGLNGPACRGSEHELVFIWSLATGKRQILLDNKDVHYSESGQNGWTTDRAWQHSFSLRDSTGATFRIHFTSQPTSRDVPNSRPFDLRIAGISYFRFNHIYQLGTPEMTVGHQTSGSGSGSGRSRGNSNEHMTPEERQQLARAKLESLKDIREKQEHPPQTGTSDAPPPPSPTKQMQRVEDSLISFDDDPAPPAAAGLPPPMPQQSYFGAGSQTGSVGMQNNPYASSMTMDSSLNYSGASGYGSSFAATNSSTTDSYFGGAAPTSSGMTSPFSNYSSSSFLPSGSMSQLPPSSSMTSNPYGASSYGAPTTNPYGQPPSSANPYAPAPASPAAADPSFSTALTPYSGTSGSTNPYVDATGRLSIGTDASGGMMPNSVPNAYGFASQPSTASPYQYPGSVTSTTASLTSPSNQSYGAQSTNSQFSYGSAPSFAQPPQQQQQQQPQHQYQYPGGGYGAPVQSTPSPYGAPPASSYPSFQTPPPQQQQPSYGGSYGGY